MKILSYLIFFNNSFLDQDTSLFGSTIYFPKESFIKIRPLSTSVIFMHELVHLNDYIKYGEFVYTLLYFFPASLIIFIIPLFFYYWKIALLLSIICLLPFPAYFRMYFEKRAYMASLYALNALSNKLKFNPYLDKQKEYFLEQFKNSSHYYMWLFPGIRRSFDEAVVNIRFGKRPYNDPIFNILDDLIAQIQTY